MYRFLSELAQPGLLLLLFILLATLNLWRKRQETRRRLLLLTIPLVLLILWCTPAVTYLAIGSLEWPYPPLAERPADAEALVVLSGYLRIIEEEGNRVELGGDTRSRCLRAVQLYRQGKPCPVLVSGGKLDPDAPGPTLAAAMHDFLRQHGVDEKDLIVEDRSRTTYENAVESCRMLDERGIHKIVLVTDAAHLSRAAACFRKQGAEVVPCGCRYRAVRMEWSPRAFLPDPAVAGGSQEAFHEWLGWLWYRLQGRV